MTTEPASFLGVIAKRSLFVALLLFILFLNLAAYLSLSQPRLNYNHYFYAGDVAPTPIEKTASRQIGWPIAFASHNDFTQNRPAHEILLGVDVLPSQIHIGLLLLNLAALVVVVLALWQTLWRISPSDQQPGTRKFVLLTLLAFVTTVGYMVIDARDSIRVGQTIQLTAFSGDESNLPEFDDVKFHDYASFRFANSNWANVVLGALCLAFVAICWGNVTAIIFTRFEKFGIVSYCLILILLIVAYNLVLDFIQIPV